MALTAEALAREVRKLKRRKVTAAADRPLWSPYPNSPQLRAFESDADVIGFGGAAGGGKALALDTPLPTPYGWTAMGEVREGDLLLDEAGRPCCVLGLSPIETPDDCYRLTFDDGSQVVCNGEHRWLTYDARDMAQITRLDPEWRARRQAKRASRVSGNKTAAFTASLVARNKSRTYDYLPSPAGAVRDTYEIAATLRRLGGRVNHAVPLAAPLRLPEASLPLDPYLLGVWLGDGTTTVGGFTTADPEMLDAWRAAGFEIGNVQGKGKANTYGVYGLKVILRALGVLGNKHVPAAYLRASYDQRLALLQGLMDTDGCADARGKCEFTNTNRELADAAAELLLSLGQKVSVSEGRATLYGKDCGPKYRISWFPTIPVFRLPRKLTRLKAGPGRRTKRFRYLVSCERIPGVLMRCLAVDSPSHLYLCGRAMIPTHNTDLGLGLAICKHRRSLILRREAVNVRAIVDRCRDLLGPLGRLNSTTGVWNLPDGRQIEFGGCPNPGDEQKFRGRPKDLQVFDEADQFPELTVRFIGGWNRTTDEAVRCQQLLCFNPPSTAEGRWLITFFAPWLDELHPNPAVPGELRWFASLPVLPGEEPKEVERPDGTPFLHNGETVTPKSRTFFPARVQDNPALMATGYVATLQALPEPLRSQLLYGDFKAGLIDDVWQVIPTAWVKAAQQRWVAGVGEAVDLTSLGVDVAYGGACKTVLAPKHGTWFGRLTKVPGTGTPDGPAAAALVRTALAPAYALLKRKQAEVEAALRQNPLMSPQMRLALLQAANPPAVNVDAIGVGTSCCDFLAKGEPPVEGLNRVIFSAKVDHARDRSGVLKFANLRAYAWWALRDALDPVKGDGLALPPDAELLADLCAPRWEMKTTGVQLEDKKKVEERIGRSPDCGDAVVLANLEMPRVKLEASVFVPPERRNDGWLGVVR